MSFDSLHLRTTAQTPRCPLPFLQPSQVHRTRDHAIGLSEGGPQMTPSPRSACPGSPWSLLYAVSQRLRTSSEPTSTTLWHANVPWPLALPCLCLRETILPNFQLSSSWFFDSSRSYSHLASSTALFISSCSSSWLSSKQRSPIAFPTFHSSCIRAKTSDTIISVMYELA